MGSIRQYNRQSSLNAHPRPVKPARGRFLLSGLIISISIALSLSSCLTREEYSQEEIAALVQSSLDERIERYKELRSDRCKEELIIRANQIVDSILISSARYTIDSLNRPLFIPKPARPEIRIIKDSTPIQPLFDSLLQPVADSLSRDSLLKDSIQ